MKILALESATLAGGAALLDGDVLVGESRANISLTHSERLMLTVDRLLQDCGWTVKDLEGLAVSMGRGHSPGCASVSPPSRAGAGPRPAGGPGADAGRSRGPYRSLMRPCPLLDARKSEVYLSLYRWTGTAKARVDYLALPPAEAARRCRFP
jgi:tRNA threonylcarbamoyladenosine biosynthesis protein TsaB